MSKEEYNPVPKSSFDADASHIENHVDEPVTEHADGNCCFDLGKGVVMVILLLCISTVYFFAQYKQGEVLLAYTRQHHGTEAEGWMCFLGWIIILFGFFGSIPLGGAMASAFKTNLWVWWLPFFMLCLVGVEVVQLLLVSAWMLVAAIWTSLERVTRGSAAGTIGGLNGTTGLNGTISTGMNSTIGLNGSRYS